MKKTLLFVLLSSICSGWCARGQSAYDAESISQVLLWEEYPERPLEITCITPLGNRANLAAFVNLSFHYPQYCVDLFAEGRMLYEVYLNSTGSLDSLVLRKPIPGCEDKGVEEQVTAALNKLQKIDETGRCKRFILEIKVRISPRPVILVKAISK